MKLEEILLTKEEIPILHKTCFQVPVSSALLLPNASFDPTLAHQMFPVAFKEWLEDLKNYTLTLEDPSEKKWISDAFLSKPFKIKQEYGKQVLLPLYWDDQVYTTPTGFPRVLSISRDGGGSLILSDEPEGVIVDSPFIRFSEEKLAHYGNNFPEIVSEEGYALMHLYHHHNVDYYPGALFLRNWAILTVNACLTQQVQQNRKKV